MNENTHPGLILTRKEHGRIRLRVPANTAETEIWVEIVDVRGGKVRVRLEAPKEVTIIRGELEEEYP